VALTFAQKLALHDALGEHLVAVKRLFKPGSKVTLVVRNPRVADDEVVVIGDDKDYAAVIAEIEKVRANL
jgi:hypothetical protein